MMIRLIGAQLRRMRWTLFSVAMYGAMSVGWQSSGFGRRMMIALPLMLAAAALTSIGMFWSREQRVLPVSPVQALRSAFCVAIILPVAILLGRLASIAGYSLAGSAGYLTLEAIGILAVFDAVYVGATVMMLHYQDGLGQRTGPGRLSRALSGLGLSIVWLAVALAWPEIVPARLADVTLLHAAGLVAGVLVTLRGVLFPDGRWPSFGVIDMSRRGGVAPTYPPAKSPDRRIDRLRGIARLLPGSVSTAIAAALLSMIVFWVFSSNLREGFRAPFDPKVGDLEFLFLGGFAVLFLAPLVAGPGLAPFLRRLKVMPVSERRVTLTLTSLPLLTPVLFWMFAAVVHASVAREWPGTWRLSVLLFICGVLSLTDALSTRMNSHPGRVLTSWLPIAAIIASMAFLEPGQLDASPVSLLSAIGALALAAALAVNHHTIVRSSSHAPVFRVATR